MTVTLPHTGLEAPHDRVRLVAPGLVEVDGEVHEICLDVDDDFTEICDPAASDAFYDWATRCRQANGDPLDLEDAFQFLRAEYATGRALDRAATDSCTVVQAMVPYGDGYLPGMTLRVWPDETRQHVIAMTQITGGPVGTWWRLFDGTQWVELEPK